MVIARRHCHQQMQMGVPAAQVDIFCNTSNNENTEYVYSTVVVVVVAMAWSLFHRMQGFGEKVRQIVSRLRYFFFNSFIVYFLFFSFLFIDHLYLK